MALQDRIDSINDAITNLSPKVDPSAVLALQEIAAMLAEVRVILTQTDASAIYIT